MATITPYVSSHKIDEHIPAVVALCASLASVFYYLTVSGLHTPVETPLGVVTAGNAASFWNVVMMACLLKVTGSLSGVLGAMATGLAFTSAFLPMEYVWLAVLSQASGVLTMWLLMKWTRLDIPLLAFCGNLVGTALYVLLDLSLLQVLIPAVATKALMTVGLIATLWAARTIRKGSRRVT